MTVTARVRGSPDDLSQTKRLLVKHHRSFHKVDCWSYYVSSQLIIL